MNAFVCESEHTRAEAEYLMSTSAQFISSADSRPILTIKQDAMSGGYIFTYGHVVVPKHTFMDVCCTVDNWAEYGTKKQSTEERPPLEYRLDGETKRYDMEYNEIGHITDKMQQIRDVHRWCGREAEQVALFKTQNETLRATLTVKREQLKMLKAKYATTKDKRTKELFEWLKQHIQELKQRIESPNQDASDYLLYAGHGIISMLFPNDFAYTGDSKLSPDKKPVRIIRGVMISGTLNKNILMSIIHHLYKDYGAHFACDFVTYYQRFMNILMQRRGFSVGLEDCTPTNTEIIEQEQEKCFLQAKMVMESEPDLELRETKILGILNQATDIGERIIREGIDPDNNFMKMIVSGAKGSMFNYVNAVNSVGQQNLEGKRAPKNYGGRTLPCYQRTPGAQYSPDVLPENKVLTEYENLSRLFQSRAFILSSYYQGLSSQEFFFLAAGGREGLIDTSVKTSRCGYLSRKLLKLLEDLTIGYNSNVVNAKGTVLQFAYGDDNLSASELIKTEKFGLQCSDVTHIADMLNLETEYEQFEATLPKKTKPVIYTPKLESEWDGIAY